MYRRPFVKSPSYQQLVQRLHALVHAGDDEILLADADPAGPESLSEAERQRIIGLCKDVGALVDLPGPELPMTPQAQWQLREATEARQAGEWDKALELLRHCGRHLEPALLSYLRGTVWMEAGDHATAALFFQRAAELEPANENYAGLYRYTKATAKLLKGRSRPQELLVPEPLSA
jgi:hypothetical protein